MSTPNRRRARRWRRRQRVKAEAAHHRARAAEVVAAAESARYPRVYVKVEGGRLSAEAAKKIQRYVDEQRASNPDAFHKVLILDPDDIAPTGTAPPRVTVTPL